MSTLGWNAASDDSDLTKKLRALCLGAAAKYGDKAVVTEALARFKAYADGGELDSDLRGVVFSTAVKFGGEDEFKKMLDAYKNVKHSDLRENLRDFIKAIIPVAEENKVKMAIHPDDPPIPLFGVPRIVSTLEDYRYILSSYDSNSNGMTFCSGSLASNINLSLIHI